MNVHKLATTETCRNLRKWFALALLESVVSSCSGGTVCVGYRDAGDFEENCELHSEISSCSGDTVCLGFWDVGDFEGNCKLQSVVSIGSGGNVCPGYKAVGD